MSICIRTLLITVRNSCDKSELNPSLVLGNKFGPKATHQRVSIRERQGESMTVTQFLRCNVTVKWTFVFGGALSTKIITFFFIHHTRGDFFANLKISTPGFPGASHFYCPFLRARESKELFCHVLESPLQLCTNAMVVNIEETNLSAGFTDLRDTLLAPCRSKNRSILKGADIDDWNWTGHWMF